MSVSFSLYATDCPNLHNNYYFTIFYMPKYLDEFVYKLNRIYFNSIFERLVVGNVYPYWQTNE
jgi:hypothetical protein